MSKNLRNDNDGVSKFMEGEIKIKSMNDYKKDIVRFQDYLVEMGGTASVLNHLLDPKEESNDKRTPRPTSITVGTIRDIFIKRRIIIPFGLRRTVSGNQEIYDAQRQRHPSI